MDAGQDIETAPGAWKFNADVANRFDEHVRRSVPCYEQVQRLALSLSDWFVQPGTRVYDLGCATGETLHAIYLRHRGRGPQIVGIDESDDMIVRATRRFATELGWEKSVSFQTRSLASNELELSAASYVVCLYTLQFLPPADRLAVLSRVRDAMIPGGALLLVEKVIAEDPLAQDIAHGLYEDFKATEGLTADQIRAKSLALRGVLRPLTVADNEQLLREAKFDRVESVFKWVSFAGWLAIR